MRKKLLAVAALFTAAFSFQSQAQRYFNPVFTNIGTDANVMYAQNIGVLTGTPKLDTLRMDVYYPMGDTTNARPLVVYLHTGSFLPPIVNGSPTGSRKDTATVEMCKEFARRGYVVAAISYRLGWNPQGNQSQRTGTILNAVYRAMIDAKSAIRFFRKNHAVGGNTWGIDTSRIMLVGQGTGGYAVQAAAYLDKPSELTLAKFIDPTTTPPQPYVVQAIAGNFDGTDSTFLNVPNHVGYSSSFNLAVNMAGALGDSTWMEAGEMPLVAFHSYNDPFAPFNDGVVLVPGTTFQVVEVAGSGVAVRRANRLNNNKVLLDGAFLNSISSNPYQIAALTTNQGDNNLYRMVIDPAVRPQAGPWDYWDSTIVKNITLPGGFSGLTAHNNAMLTNPNMSKAKAMAYIDTVQGYLAPRAVQVLNLPGAVALGVKNGALKNVNLTVYPNPATDQVTISSTTQQPNSVTLTDLTGRVVRNQAFQSAGVNTLSVQGLDKGVYLLKAQYQNGELVQKLIIQ